MQTPIHVRGGTFWNIYAGFLYILPVATTKIQHYLISYFLFPTRNSSSFLIYNAHSPLIFIIYSLPLFHSLINTK